MTLGQNNQMPRQTEVSEFRRNTNLLVLGLMTSSVRLKWGSLFTVHNIEMSFWRNWKMELCSSSRVSSWSEMRIHFSTSLYSFSFMMTTPWARYLSTKDFGVMSWLIQLAKWLSTDSIVYLGCWRVMRRYFWRARAIDGNTACAASLGSIGIAAPPMKENQVVNCLYVFKYRYCLRTFFNYLSQESVYHTQWVYPHMKFIQKTWTHMCMKGFVWVTIMLWRYMCVKKSGNQVKSDIEHIPFVNITSSKIGSQIIRISYTLLTCDLTLYMYCIALVKKFNSFLFVF